MNEEEKCRYCRESEAADKGNDFLFFTVFQTAECKDDEDVYTMFAQWKKLMSLVDDPLAGHYVSQLFQEVIENCREDIGEGEMAFPVLVGNPKAAKVVKANFGKNSTVRWFESS